MELPLLFCEELLWESGKGADLFFLDQRGSIELEQFGLGMLKWNQLPEKLYYPRGCTLWSRVPCVIDPALVSQNRAGKVGAAKGLFSNWTGREPVPVRCSPSRLSNKTYTS